VAKARERACKFNVSTLNNLDSPQRCGVDNKDIYPPDMLSMSNELVAPKILRLSFDTDVSQRRILRPILSAACSYELLAALERRQGAKPGVFRCASTAISL